MKPQSSWSKLGVVVAMMFFAVLFVSALGSPAPASAGLCSYSDYLWYLGHPQYMMPPECAVWGPSTTSTSTTTTPGEDREPPPSTGPVPIGSQGGEVYLGTTMVTIPPGLLPPGSTVTLTRYPQNSVPIGDAGAAFQGPGDVRMGVLIQDANGNVIHSLPPPGMTVAFVTGYSPWSQSPESQRDIQLWNGRNWVDQPTDFVWTPFLPSIVGFSTTVTNF